MEKKPTQNLEFIKKEWDAIIAYEQHVCKQRNNSYIPVTEILEYFGEENICKLFGCRIVTKPIAIELIKEAFK